MIQETNQMDLVPSLLVRIIEGAGGSMSPRGNSRLRVKWICSETTLCGISTCLRTSRVNIAVQIRGHTCSRTSIQQRTSPSLEISQDIKSPSSPQRLAFGSCLPRGKVSAGLLTGLLNPFYNWGFLTDRNSFWSICPSAWHCHCVPHHPCVGLGGTKEMHLDNIPENSFPGIYIKDMKAWSHTQRLLQECSLQLVRISPKLAHLWCLSRG